MLKTALLVEDDKGNKVPGIWETSSEEREGSFVPATQWHPGAYRLYVETRLEDLAGNNVNRAFEVDISQRSKAFTKDIVALPFSITSNN